jgi:hypothetical protein
MADQRFTPKILRESGELVTTQVCFGGLGLGYLLDGQVYITTGTAYTIKAKDGPMGLEGYLRDGGSAYRAKARAMLG